MAMRINPWCMATLLAIGLTFSPARASTAFQSQPIADNVVSPHVKGRLIWIRSLTGQGVDRHRWAYLYFDPFADSNGRLVVVRDGAVTKIDQGLVELDHFRVLPYEESEIMPAAQLKLDSAQALQAMQAAGHIENVPLTTVHYSLEMSDENNVPVWKMTLYCPRGDDEIEFAHAAVSALTGQVFDLKVDHERLP